MSSESDRQLSMEELRRRNMQKPPAETLHPTAGEWQSLTAALTAMGELLAEQVLLLEKIAARPKPWATQEQMTELIREAREIHRLLEQAGKRRERRFSLPTIPLPRPLEQSDNPVPISDATTVHRHADSKTLRREREKKIALGHREDDHEDTQNWQQTM